MRKGWLAVAISLVLMLASLLYVEHVLAVSYEAVNYGFPMPWLVYVVNTLLPVNRWVPNIVGLFVDYLFWLGVSFAGVYMLSSHGAKRLLLRS
jgi:hypothetical protein